MVPDAIYAHYLAAFSNRASGISKADNGSTGNQEYEAARALGVCDALICCQDATKYMLRSKVALLACLHELLGAPVG